MSSSAEPQSEPSVENSNLLDWPTLKERTDWTGLLVGNGASIAVWEQFAYDSIFERAQSSIVDHPLEAEDKDIFDAFDTTNFEQVLAALKTSSLVLGVLGRDADFLRARYESVQNALFEAIHSVHVGWGASLDFEKKLRRIRDELVNYEWVYSLNYDLILYWAVMSRDRGAGIADFFWRSDLSFNPSDVVPKDWASDWTRIVWLHGGIHLRRHIADGTTFKARPSAESFESLLDKFKTSYSGQITPLLVSEGTAEDKYRSIMRSAYLEFALRSLSEHEGGLVVFGSSLRSEDEHLVRAINAQPIPDLAFSIRASNDAATIRTRKAELRAQFPKSNLYFYDSATHPLGDSDLRVKRRKLFGRTL
jgi:hypothetical protein